MPEQTPTLSVAVFSFNRGRYLRNLLDSIASAAPAIHVSVYDDRSEDPETFEILKSCAAEVHINDELNPSRHGNLYTNMQSALNGCSTRYLLLTQDDTQFVPSLSDSDFETLEKVFSDPNIAFLRPQFLKAAHAERFLATTKLDTEFGILRPLKSFEDVEPGNAYCDVVICDVAKLRKVNWQFQESERANQLAARKHFSGMPFMLKPFQFYCPEVPSYRDRKLYFASKTVQNRRQGEVAGYEMLKGNCLDAFLDRDPSVPPIAEDFLTPTIADVKRPFVYQDYARSPFLHTLYKVESRIYRIYKGLFK